MATAASPSVLSASSISGDKVENMQGENLGDIKDLMIDLGSGKVAYAVLDFGGFLGIGNKLFAVPFKALELCAEKRCFRLNVSKEQLEKQDGFDQNDWPDMADRTWGKKLHSDYNVAPYWP